MLAQGYQWSVKAMKTAFSLLMTFTLISTTEGSQRSFQIDNVGNFLMDDMPFKFAAGELHYFRIPKPYWGDRIFKTHAAGFNVIQTAIEWSFHEPFEGEFQFDGDRDLEEFIRTAEKEGMYVVVRAGPYIGADRDLGGFPFWLLAKENITLRTANPTFLKHAEKWLDTLLSRLEPLLYGNGGPVIMIQVESDYGSFTDNDPAYTKWLSAVFTKYVKNGSAVLFTKDSSQWSAVKKGNVPGALSTVGFGGGAPNPFEKFLILNRIQPGAPWFNSELVAGARMYWGDKYLPNDQPPSMHPEATALYQLLRTMHTLLQANNSVTMSMIHGGTNFGFSSGSHFMPNSRMSMQYHSYPTKTDFKATTTSYDFGAPIAEEGRLRKVFFATQKVLQLFFPVKEVRAEEEARYTEDYGEFDLTPVISLLDSPAAENTYKKPPTFEELGQHAGFVAYTVQIENCTLPAQIEANFADRGMIIMGESIIATGQFRLTTSINQGGSLTILVENTGRESVGSFRWSQKGLNSVKINGKLPENFKVKQYPLSLRDIEIIKQSSTPCRTPLPAFFKGTFQLPQDQEALDTFFDMRGWGKGVVFLNGVNLGRYWTIGPILSLYVPGCYLNRFPDKNTVVVLELEQTPEEPSIRTSDRHVTFRSAQDGVSLTKTALAPRQAGPYLTNPKQSPSVV